MGMYLVRNSLGNAEIIGSGRFVGELAGYDDMGSFLGKLGKAISKGAGAVYKATGTKDVVNVVSHPIRSIKHPLDTVKKLAHAAISPAIATTKLVASLPGIKQLLSVMTSLAATPIKLAIRPTIKKVALDYAKAARRKTPNADDNAAASRQVLKAMKASKNPLVKAGGYILEKVGTGVAGGTGNAKWVAHRPGASVGVWGRVPHRRPKRIRPQAVVGINIGGGRYVPIKVYDVMGDEVGDGGISVGVAAAAIAAACVATMGITYALARSAAKSDIASAVGQLQQQQGGMVDQNGNPVPPGQMQYDQYGNPVGPGGQYDPYGNPIPPGAQPGQYPPSPYGATPYGAPAGYPPPDYSSDDPNAGYPPDESEDF